MVTSSDLPSFPTATSNTAHEPNLEERLRHMILNPSGPTAPGAAAPPPNPAGPSSTVHAHPAPSAIENLPPYSRFRPSPSSGLPLPPGLPGLSPQHGFPPAPVPALNYSPQAAGVSSYMLPPHLRNSPVRNPPEANQRRPYRRGKTGAPPPNGIDHFPPLGTNAPPKAASPPPRTLQRKDGISPQIGQRTQYQPLNVHSHTPHSPQRPAQRAPASAYTLPPPGQHHSDDRQSQVPVEQLLAEQAHNLGSLAQTIIPQAAQPEIEVTMKKALLAKLGKICKEVLPESELMPFGSFVTGFATASSDLDVVFSHDGKPFKALDCVDNNSDGNSFIGPTPDANRFTIPLLLEKTFRDHGYEVQLLTRTRVPIIKLSQKPTEDVPIELQCDIGFDNFLALRNTEMLLCYSKYDPRVRQMVLFVKWWAKRRRINSPYRGTLSSYGYVLMILHYLINVADPPVLPNLQLFPIPEDAKPEDLVARDRHGEYRVFFFKDVETLEPSRNKSSLGELLRGFFDYYSFKFLWGQLVISIRTSGGILTKQEKHWTAAVTRPEVTKEGETWEVKDRYLFAVEDPFETEHNVGRTCTHGGITRIRDELRRAMRLIKYRDRGAELKTYLCQEMPPDRPFVRREQK